MAAHQPKDIGNLTFYCPVCGWTGKGDAVDVQVNDVIRCPHCKEPLEQQCED